MTKEFWESLSKNSDIPKIIRAYEKGQIDKKTAKDQLELIANKTSR